MPVNIKDGVDYSEISNTPNIAYTNAIAADDFTQTEVNNLRNNYNYMITSAGTNDQIWTSDGTGAGQWQNAPSGTMPNPYTSGDYRFTNALFVGNEPSGFAIYDGTIYADNAFLSKNQASNYLGRRIWTGYANNKYRVQLGSYDSNGSEGGILSLYGSGSNPTETIEMDGRYGDITYAGSLSNSKSHPTKSNQEIVYHTVISDEAGTYHRGTAKLQNGVVIINLPEHFSIMSSEENLTAQITPRGNCNGLFIEDISSTKLVVRELNNGSSNVEFDYFVNGVRAGYEDFEVIQTKQ